ncbi:MAG: Uncharacterised protein [Prochlorococcus marinus str. MIT 9313]|nr:MAG: Uncharacterised protein [Prochlorococcus marinus str. MIT 9313]
MGLAIGVRTSRNDANALAFYITEMGVTPGQVESDVIDPANSTFFDKAVVL